MYYKELPFHQHYVLFPKLPSQMDHLLQCRRSHRNLLILVQRLFQHSQANESVKNNYFKGIIIMNSFQLM